MIDVNLCVFEYSKGGDTHAKPLTSHAKGPHTTSERREFEPRCALDFKVRLLSHPTKKRFFGTPCIQEFGVKLLFDRQGEQNSKKTAGWWIV